MSSVELQINIHPNDWRYFRLMATHQIRKLSGQIDGVRLTLDLHNSFSGRYRSSQYELNTSAIKEEINSLQQCFPNVICEEVDYSPQTKKQVAKFFFNLQTIPDKA